jgi:hypothetical protein
LLAGIWTYVRHHHLAFLALFIALGGTAWALEANSVKSKHIVNGQVKSRDIIPMEFIDAGLPLDPSADCLGGSQWVNTEPDHPVGYYRDPLGNVHLTGRPYRCGEPTNQFFTLPEGFRPDNAVGVQLPMLKYSGAPGTMTSLHVSNGGPVVVNGSTGNDEFSLDGISFRCGPSGQNGCP